MRTPEEKQAAMRARRDTKDESVLAGKSRTDRVDLGLALLQCVLLPGESLTRYDIACWCGVTDAAIYRMERQALKKIRNRLMFGQERATGREMAA
jgi:hypothetical protein